MNNSYQRVIDNLGEKRVTVDEIMSKHTSYRIGGKADLYFQAKTIHELVYAYQLAKKLDLPVFILGGGTNLLVSDNGFRGLVIKNETSQISLVGIRGNNVKQDKHLKLKVHTVYIRAESGVTTNRLVRYTLDQGFSGLEFFLGQPGTVGGSMYINSHNLKMGKYFGDNVTQAAIIDKEGREKKVTADYFQFGYDSSVIQKTKEIVLNVIIKLTAGEKEIVWKRAQETLNYRKLTQPYGYFTAGCAFKNISKTEAVRLSTPNHICSAGFLIESVGLKGKTVGGAKFSTEHANFIINFNDARADDVIKLINLAKNKVKDRYKVELKEEIVLLGEF